MNGKDDLEYWFDAPGWDPEIVNNNNAPNIPNLFQFAEEGIEILDILLKTDIEYRDYAGLIDSNDGSVIGIHNSLHDIDLYIVSPTAS